jgi:Zn finger protein HypA/HybF involved in hydrogenase expression
MELPLTRRLCGMAGAEFSDIWPQIVAYLLENSIQKLQIWCMKCKKHTPPLGLVDVVNTYRNTESMNKGNYLKQRTAVTKCAICGTNKRSFIKAKGMKRKRTIINN